MDKEMEMNERIRQRELIKEFYWRWHKRMANGMEPVEKLGKRAYIVFVAMLSLIPYHGEEVSLIASMFTFNIFPVTIFMVQKMNVTEGGKSNSMYEKLKYLPIDKREIRYVRIEGLANFLKKPLLAAVIAQLLGAWIFNHQITIANVVYPLLVYGFVPFALGVLMTLER